jgi:signal transduction histidine kinase
MGFVFLAATGLLVATLLFLYRVDLTDISAEEQMATELLTLNRLGDFLSTLKDAETGTRGYVLTGEESYLRPYTNARNQVQTRLNDLHELVGAGDLPKARVERLTALTYQKLEELEGHVQTRRNEGLDPALALVGSHRGKELMDDIRDEVQQMRADEQKEFDAATRRSSSAGWIRMTTFIAACSLNLGFLVWAFKKLSREMRDRALAQHQLREHAANLERTVEERTAKLREMISELQHVSYAIAHDMRAPLRAMSAFAEMLLDESSSASAQSQDYCRRIVTGGRRLDTLIQDALNYNKAVLADLPLEPVDLSRLLRGLIDTYPNLHPKKAEIRIEGILPSVLGNESLLTQCFSNLLGNAVKFVAPGIRPQVRIWAETTADVGRIWVQDNGVGIPEHAQKRLFQMFQKLDNEYEGTGIGLAIVRKVVERMGGKVGVKSELGNGSRFWVEFPLATKV